MHFLRKTPYYLRSRFLHDSEHNAALFQMHTQHLSNNPDSPDRRVTRERDHYFYSR